MAIHQQPMLKQVLTGKINQDKPNNIHQHVLPREHQHGEPHKNNYITQQVFSLLVESYG